NASGGQVSSSTPSITTTVANTMLVACFGRAGGSAIGAPTGITERFHAETSSSTNAASESADVAQAAAGASGAKASTGNTANIGQLIALAPQSASCPPDTVKAAGTSCTDDGNVCTADVCNGTVGAPTCTHAAGNAGTVCRAAVGGCDIAETCTGTSTACPADAIKVAGTVCRAAAGECDLAETCDGVTTGCPTDVLKASGTTCTDDGNACTTDVCNGTSATCTHAEGNAGTVGRPAAGVCDGAETWTGTSTTCPANAFRPSSTVCRAAVDLCDAAENCTGTGASCPADAIKSAGTVCRAAAGECDLAETCDGVTTAWPTDAKKSAGAACTAAANPCSLGQ